MADNFFKFFTKSIERPVKITEGRDVFFTYLPGFGGTTIKDTTTMSGQGWAYNYCPAVNAIINKKVRAFTNAKWKIVNEKGDPATGKNLGILPELIKRPNPSQTWNEFIAQAKVYEQTFGEMFILPVMPMFFNNKTSVSAIWVVPNWLITENITGKIFNQTKIDQIVENYVINFNGYSSDPIPADQILRIRDGSVPVTDMAEKILHGQSRLYPLTNPVTNIISAYEARNVMITRKGALGILSNDGKDVGGTIPLRKEDKESLQNDFKKYGLSKEQYQVIITNASLRWQAMTFPTKELMLFEEIEDDTRQIADAFDFPMHLLGFKKGTTYANVNEAKKSFYQDATIPEAENFANAFAQYFDLPDGLRLVPSYDHLEIFQKSRKDQAEVVRIICEGYKTAYEKGIVTLEEWRSAMNLDPNNFTGNTFYEPPAEPTRMLPPANQEPKQ